MLAGDEPIHGLNVPTSAGGEVLPAQELQGAPQFGFCCGVSSEKGECAHDDETRIQSMFDRGLKCRNILGKSCLSAAEKTFVPEGGITWGSSFLHDV